MKLIFAPLGLVILSGVGCTSSSQRAPVASAPNDSASDGSQSASYPDRAQDPTDGSPTSDPRRAAEGQPDGVRADAPSRPVAASAAAGPYRVRIVDAAMHDLRLFRREGRSYVLGTIGDRYSIVLSNPTARRVEAVISIDGLDAIDGKSADYVHKRGYILPAYGSVAIEGFRTSLERVAAFRFSSVADSYAARQGQARDVGVIGVAFFPEQAPVAVAPPLPRRTLGSYGDWDGQRAPAPNAPAPQASRSEGAPARAAAASPSSADVAPLAEGSSSMGGLGRERPERKGLGTEFGEARESHVEETEFVRASAILPSDIVAFRYNDRAGLLALGFRVDPPPVADGEVHTRETADPFRANRFAAPPP